MLKQSQYLLYVPQFCITECVNVLWKQVQFRGMRLADAQHLVRDLQKLPLQLLPVKTYYQDALNIGIKHHLAIYDSIYIALAKHLNYPLVTVDQKQSNAALQENVMLKPITDFVQ